MMEHWKGIKIDRGTTCIEEYPIFGVVQVDGEKSWLIGIVVEGFLAPMCLLGIPYLM